MDKKLIVEVLKAEYAILKDKLLLFSAGFGGSVSVLLSVDNPFLIFSTIAFGSASFIGILINLQKAGKIQKELSQLKRSLEND